MAHLASLFQLEVVFNRERFDFLYNAHIVLYSAAGAVGTKKRAHPTIDEMVALVTVMPGLIRPVYRYTDVVGLFLGQLGEMGADFLEV